jgi:hypothetical protein
MLVISVKDERLTMKAKDLIKKLKVLDPDAEVCLEVEEGIYAQHLQLKTDTKIKIQGDHFFYDSLYAPDETIITQMITILSMNCEEPNNEN